MALRINRLQIDIATTDARYGCDFSFRDGLNIIRADNTCGKTTCSIAILFALGLEGVLQSTHELPFSDAVTVKLFDGGREHNIVQSAVVLEISNNRGEIATIRRAIRGQGRDHRLLTVWSGHVLSEPGTAGGQRDLYVRVAGAAQNESGFHYWLKTFIGWVMPQIPASDGSEMFLYMEHVTPLHYLEQKRGWSGIQAGTPFLGARDPAKRALEFILELSGPVNSLARDRIKDELVGIRERWKALLNRADELAAGINGRISGIPEVPDALWPPTPAPYIEVLEGQEKIRAQDLATAIQAQLVALRDNVIPTIKVTSGEIEQRLRDLEAHYIKSSGLRNAMQEQIERDEAYLAIATHRLETLREEHKRNREAKKLQDMGSTLLGIADLKNCHACGQVLPASLLPTTAGIPIMSIEENISFIESQIESVSSFNGKLTLVLSRRRTSLRNVDGELAQTATQVRDLKESLLEDGRLPSREAIRTSIILEERGKRLAMALDSYERHLGQFGLLSAQFTDAHRRLKLIPSQVVPQDDKAKLEVLQTSLREQLQLYGFTSFPIDQISISDVSYRPSRYGAEVNYGASASDTIRLIWAYIMSLMECSHQFSGQHAGLVIFDEPKQQSAKDASLEALLRRAATTRERGQQVIIFTSEPDPSLTSMIASLDVQGVQVRSVLGRIIKKTGI